MMNVLKEPRTIVLRGRAEHFASYVELEKASASVIKMMQDLEAAMGPQQQGSAMEWASLGMLAQMLAEITEGQNRWLADCDTELEIAIESLRSEIRTLQVSSINVEEEK